MVRFMVLTTGTTAEGESVYGPLRGTDNRTTTEGETVYGPLHGTDNRTTTEGETAMTQRQGACLTIACSLPYHWMVPHPLLAGPWV